MADQSSFGDGGSEQVVSAGMTWLEFMHLDGD